MDPLTVGSTIYGAISATARIGLTISAYVTTAKNAPSEINNIRCEVDSIRVILQQLETLLSRVETISQSRTSLILVEQVVVTLSAVVTTLSDLNVFVEQLGPNNSMKILDRTRWISRRNTAAEYTIKLQAQKSSLTLMLTILTCDSNLTAERAVEPLHAIMNEILDGQQFLVQRLASLEGNPAPSILSVSTITQRTNSSDSNQPIPQVPQDPFEAELQQSWVYKRSRNSNNNYSGAFSLISSDRRTIGLSMISGISLSDMSLISVLELPIYLSDLSNGRDYHPSGSQTSPKAALPLPSSTIANLNQMISVDRGPIFGISLDASMALSQTSVALCSISGSATIKVDVPTVVANCGNVIKERGILDELLFTRAGATSNVRKLQQSFSEDTSQSSDHGLFFGEAFRWEDSQFSVRDAATLLLRYLRLLPEPVVPYDCYKKFICIAGIYFTTLESPCTRNDRWLQVKIALMPAMESLPRTNRHLLLYILDLIRTITRPTFEKQLRLESVLVAMRPRLLSAREWPDDVRQMNEARNTIDLLVEYFQQIPLTDEWYDKAID